MTKKKTTTKPQANAETSTETETPELSAAQVYDQQLQQALDEWVPEILELLESKIRPLDMPKDGRKFKPRTSQSFRTGLRNQGRSLSTSWHVPPPRPPAAPMPATLKAEPTGLDKAGFYDSAGRRTG